MAGREGVGPGRSPSHDPLRGTSRTVARGRGPLPVTVRPVCHTQQHASVPVGNGKCIRPPKADTRKGLLLGEAHDGLVGIDFMVEPKQVENAVDKKVPHLTGGAVAVTFSLFQGARHRDSDIGDQPWSGCYAA